MEQGKPEQSPQPGASKRQPQADQSGAGQTGWRGTPPPRKNKPLFVLATAVLAVWFVTLAVLAYLS